MSVNYGVYPFDKRVADDLAASEGFAPPPGLGLGRNPTVEEIRAVLDALTDYEVEYGGPGWQGGDWGEAALWPRGPREGRPVLVLDLLKARPEEVGRSFYFPRPRAGADELVLDILIRLARVCGPQVLFCDTGGPSLVIGPDTDPEQALLAWLSDEDVEA